MSTKSTYIHKDKGDKDQNKTLRYFLNRSVNTVYPFMVLPKWPMVCQFINAHNKAISNIFNFNTNIQIEDASQVFYNTLYTSKSTQDEDSEKQIRIGCAVIKRIKRVLNEKHNGEPSFGEGLSRVLSWLNAATTRNGISATMAHLIPCNEGSRFVYSHTFSDLLVGQMEATLEGQDIYVRIRSNKIQNKIITWPDSLADDYIHRPIEYKLDQICFYEMTTCYKKGFKAFRNIQGGVKKYTSVETHPGYKFSHLIQLKLPCIKDCITERKAMSTSLADKVADMSATCRPDSQMSALLAEMPLSRRHNFDPDTFFSVGICRHPPNFKFSSLVP